MRKLAKTGWLYVAAVALVMVIGCEAADTSDPAPEKTTISQEVSPPPVAQPCPCGENCKCGAGANCKCGAEGGCMGASAGGCKCGSEGGCKCGSEGGCKCGAEGSCKCGAEGSCMGAHVH